MHEIKIKGYIRTDSVKPNLKHIILNAYNIDKIKNVVATYGEVNFVPFIGKQGVKVKPGDLNAISAIHGMTVDQYLADNYMDRNVKIIATIKKNRFKDSTSISLILRQIINDDLARSNLARLTR